MKTYADGNDVIAAYEKKIVGLSSTIERIESEMRPLRDAIVLSVEADWEDNKLKHLSNAEKRRIAVDNILVENTEYTRMAAELKEFKEERRLTEIARDNEVRAFRLKVAELNAKAQ